MKGNLRKHTGVETLTKEAKQIFIAIKLKQGHTQSS